eukprot:6985450-Heterocapsa_arctica.AAC.1
MQEKLQQVTDECKANVTSKPDPDDDDPQSKMQQELKQAAGTGVMDMRGTVGRFVYRTLKMDKPAKAEFTACGKCYDKQRAFK